MQFCPSTLLLLLLWHPAPSHRQWLISAQREHSDLSALRVWITKTPRKKSQSWKIAALMNNKVGKEDKSKGVKQPVLQERWAVSDGAWEQRELASRENLYPELAGDQARTSDLFQDFQHTKAAPGLTSDISAYSGTISDSLHFNTSCY